MYLTVRERLLLVGILPAQGDILTMRTTDDLRRSLIFSEEEEDELELKVDGNRYVWNEKKAFEKNIAISAKGVSLIIMALTALDKEEKLTWEHISLWDKFFPDDGKSDAAPE